MPPAWTDERAAARGDLRRRIATSQRLVERSAQEIEGHETDHLEQLRGIEAGFR